ncbi:MAG: hypothetical protein FWG37_01935 [Clostridia bacterium]|nr:hypothetical protein [Clostridia bacterium]
MTYTLEETIERIVTEEVEKLNRPDLVRQPLVAFSSADDPGYAELKERIGEWHLTPAELLPDAKSVISYFIPLAKEVVLEPQKSAHGSSLWGEAYAVINEYFGHINDVLFDTLIGLGFSAKTIHATRTYNPEDLKSTWSHRSAAAIAGLGSFGVNRMLITAKGSGGRFCSVLTSAPLHAKQSGTQPKCLRSANGSCGLCVNICPVCALTSDDFDKFACQRELIRNGEFQKAGGGFVAETCGKCVSICPLAYIE